MRDVGLQRAPQQGLLSQGRDCSARPPGMAPLPLSHPRDTSPASLGTWGIAPQKGIPRPPDRLKHLSSAAGVEMFKGGAFGIVAVFARHLVRKGALLWVGSGLLGEILPPGRCP